jgi:hypothetical protein
VSSCGTHKVPVALHARRLHPALAEALDRVQPQPGSLLVADGDVERVDLEHHRLALRFEVFRGGFGVEPEQPAHEQHGQEDAHDPERVGDGVAEARRC